MTVALIPALALIAERDVVEIREDEDWTEVILRGDQDDEAIIVTFDRSGDIHLGASELCPRKPLRPSIQRLLELREMSYSSYMQSAEWKARSRYLRLIAPYCERCHDTERQLQVHHRTYGRRGCELDTDLEVLCAPCHRLEHTKAA